MKKYNIVFLIVFAILVSCKSSYTKIGDKNANYIPYYLKVYEADSLYYANNYMSYKNEIENLFSKYEPINMLFYWEYEKYVKSLILTEKDKTHRKELENLITNFGYKEKSMMKDTILGEALKNTNLSLEYLNALEEKYISTLDLEFREQLKIMNYNDQEVRKREGLTYEEKKPLIREVDIINDSIFKNYILNNGFPNDKKVGIYQIYENEKDGFAINLLLNHFSFNGSYEFYKKELPFYIKNGTCDPRNYSMLIDRWYIINKNFCFYCFSWLKELEKIKNDKNKIKEINEERKKIGLPSINQEKILFERLYKNY